jgi:D-alanyl-D-alanine carboxypeptidase
MTRIPLVFAAFLAMTAGVSADQAESKHLSDTQFEKLKEQVQGKLDGLRAAAEFPGISVGVILADGRSAGVVSGFADVENKVSLKPAHRLLAGSVGKTFVAAVVLQLAEEGKLDLDDKLEKWLGKEPWFSRLPNAHDITLRSLLNHTAGLAEYFEQKGFTDAIKAEPLKEWTVADRVAYVLDTKPLFAVGMGWSYADTDYILAGLVAERAAGKPLFDEVDRRLLEPLKLPGIVRSDRREVTGLIVGYAARNPLGYEGRTLTDGKLVINPQLEWAGGGLATTPTDLARWAKLLYEGRAFQKKETLSAMLTGVDATGGRGGGKGNKYGLGVQIRSTEWGLCYGHAGWFPGYMSEVAYFPDHKVAIAVQFNTDVRKSLKKGLSTYVADVARIVLAADK